MSFFVLYFLVFFFCSRWTFADVPLIFFCPADHVPDWQSRILLGRVNVKKTTRQVLIFLSTDLLSVPQSVGENVKTCRWDHRLLRKDKKSLQGI